MIDKPSFGAATAINELITNNNINIFWTAPRRRNRHPTTIQMGTNTIMVTVSSPVVHGNPLNQLLVPLGSAKHRERRTRLISSLSIGYPFSHLEDSFNTAISRQSNLLIKPVDMCLLLFTIRSCPCRVFLIFQNQGTSSLFCCLGNLLRFSSLTYFSDSLYLF